MASASHRAFGNKASHSKSLSVTKTQTLAFKDGPLVYTRVFFPPPEESVVVAQC